MTPPQQADAAKKRRKLAWQDAAAATPACGDCGDTGGVTALLRANPWAEYTFRCPCLTGQRLEVVVEWWAPENSTADGRRLADVYLAVPWTTLNRVALAAVQRALATTPAAAIVDVERLATAAPTFTPAATEVDDGSGDVVGGNGAPIDEQWSSAASVPF